MYDEARAEGGILTVYAGGDTAEQQDGTVAAFHAAFPALTLSMIVDYSKYHDVRIDRQLATDSLVCDVAPLGLHPAKHACPRDPISDPRR
jgi:hypothetical protein